MCTKLSLPVALLLFVGLTACAEKPLAENKPDDACWLYSDSLTLSYTPAADTLGLSLSAEFLDEYAYSNLYLRLWVRFADGRDTVLRHSQTFVDPAGAWLSKRKAGAWPVVFRGFASLPVKAGQPLNLSIRQDMRDDRLCGIRRVQVLALP